VDARGLVPLGQDPLVQLEMQLYYHSAGRCNSQLKTKKTDDTYMAIHITLNLLLTCKFSCQIC